MHSCIMLGCWFMQVPGKCPKELVVIHQIEMCTGHSHKFVNTCQETAKMLRLANSKFQLKGLQSSIVTTFPKHKSETKQDHQEEKTILLKLGQQLLCSIKITSYPTSKAIL